jgi:uncharacterized protein YukE
MSRKLVKSKGVNLERQLDSAKIKSESDDLIEEGTALQELAERFNADKNKLEDEIEKVEKSPLSAEDKKRILEELKKAVQDLQAQYDREVAEKQKQVYEALEEEIQLMDDLTEELDKQATSLRDVNPEAASTDASAAADIADDQKKENEEMKEEYLGKLKLQKDQAEMMARQIRTRRLRR